MLIKVGPDSVNFGIHKGLLCHYSFYFKAALTGEFKEASEGIVVLRDEDVDVFKRFNEWLYTRALIGPEKDLDSDEDCYSEEDLDSEEDSNLICQYRMFIRLYIFAEKRGIAALQNAVTDAIIIFFRKPRTVLAQDTIALAWENTSQDSGLHRLLVDICVRKTFIEKAFKTEKQRTALPKDFLIELVLALTKTKDNRKHDIKLDIGKYHCKYS